MEGTASTLTEQLLGFFGDGKIGTNHLRVVYQNKIVFTGIIQTTGIIQQAGLQFLIEAAEGSWANDPFAIGESIAVNGVCLTLVPSNQYLCFDLSEETLDRTTLSHLAPGMKVNLERAMRPSDRFGGHIVQGHVDSTGRITAISELDGSTRIDFAVDPQFDRYLANKGSITLDGISLTVNEPANGQFWVAVIPHTLEVTTLGSAKTDDLVNVEFDILVKHVERLLKHS